MAELGELETPILLTSTLSVPRVADALLDYMLGLPGNEGVVTVNAVVGEANDGYLNGMRGRHITRDDVLNAIKNARSGAVEEGSVGAGTGTVAFGFKGGIAPRREAPAMLGGYTLGVLVQTNFGGILRSTAHQSERIRKFYLKDELSSAMVAGVRSWRNSRHAFPTHPWLDHNCDRNGAPVDARNLRRIAARAMSGLARTGAAGSNGSGDYAIAFSTSTDLRIKLSNDAPRPIPPRNIPVLPNDAMSPLFLAAIEATEEAIYNSLFRATTIKGRGRTVEALPLNRTLEILRKHGAL